MSLKLDYMFRVKQKNIDLSDEALFYYSHKHLMIIIGIYKINKDVFVCIKRCQRCYIKEIVRKLMNKLNTIKEVFFLGGFYNNIRNKHDQHNSIISP